MHTFAEWLEEKHPEAIDEGWKKILNRAKRGAYWAGDKAMAVGQPVGAAAAAGLGGYLGWKYGATFDTIPNKMLSAITGAPMAAGAAYFGGTGVRNWLGDKMYDLDKEYKGFKPQT